MKLLQMQPTFAITIRVPTDQAMTQLRNAIHSSSLSGPADSAGRCVDFKIEPEDRRFWSPHLSIQVSETESGSKLLGRFSPRPEIWTMFMAVYFIAAIAIFGAAIYGYVQWAMGTAPWAFLGMPIGLVVILVLHIASVIGQNLSSDQMELLRSRFDQTMSIAFNDSEKGGKV